MSGTTAFGSFSVIEAESLIPDDIQDQLHPLYKTSTEFLRYLVPDGGTIETDDQTIRELQDPSSKLSRGYIRNSSILEAHLRDFKTENNVYIRPRTIHRALKPNRDPGEPQFGVDLILYLANLVVFTRNMLRTKREDKRTWEVLREIDRSFPQHFMPKVAQRAIASGVGDSTLVADTFDLGLELRTHMAIMSLESAAKEPNFDPNDTLNEVFYRADSEGLTGFLRGWQVPGLYDGDLSEDQLSAIDDRIQEIRSSFGDLAWLVDSFPWNSVLLQLSQWARLRHEELQTAIGGVGGIDTIAEIARNNSALPAGPSTKPNKSRTSFTKERRRLSGKSSVDLSKDAIVDALIASSKDFHAPPAAQEVHATIEESVTDKGTNLTTLVNDEGDEHNLEAPLPKGASETDLAPTLDDEIVPQPDEAPATEDVPGRAPSPSNADYLKAFYRNLKADKENSTKNIKTNEENSTKKSIFDRQETAVRLEFDTGFDSPGPSSKGKERQAEASKKRSRAVAEDDSDEEDDFETAHSTQKARERREKAPVKKRVRIEAAPSPTPSDQGSSRERPTRPPVARINGQRRSAREESSISEGEAPDMTEEAPATAPVYRQIRGLAHTNQRVVGIDRRRKPRKHWTPHEEDAFVEYMEEFPQKYALILEHDAASGYHILQDRTQVNLKDKARNMAANMIK
jgi:hypothetical protein